MPLTIDPLDICDVHAGYPGDCCESAGVVWLRRREACIGVGGFAGFDPAYVEIE